MLQSPSPSFGPRALDFFTSIVLQLFLFMARDWELLAGELTQLQDANWEGALVLSLVSSSANFCIVLRHLELQICFLFCVHKSCELCPGCVAAGMREEKLALSIYINKPH